MEQVGLLK